jgi:bifunctional non-homologous end joining protein LigD
MDEALKSRARADRRPDGDALRRRLARLRAPRREVRFVAPMLATLVDRVPAGPGWVFEVKYDGVRVLAHRAGARVSLLGRTGQDFTPRYPELVEALRALPLDRFLIDGEIVAYDEHGRSSFQRLQARMHVSRAADVERARATTPVNAVFFDALALDGRDLRALPLVERKACLALLLPSRGVLAYGDHVEGDGEAFFEAATERQLEGIVAKKADSRYESRRSRDWLKIKCQLRQEFVIGGWTDPQGARPYFGALHLGLYEGDRLVYVSKVGTGFDDRTLTLLRDRMKPLARASSPFDVGTPRGRGHHWIEPRLVGEVRFTEWTADGGIRHPAFLGLRDDKRPEDCRRERPVPVAQAAPDPAPAAAGAGRVTIRNARKVFWPDEGYTKGDLVAYYEAVAPWLLSYLRERPVVLTRYPDGITGKSFFQKDAPDWTPDWIRTVRVWSEASRRDIDYFVIDDLDALRYVINLGVIPLHLWASRVGTLDRPDWLVLDLDPKGAPFAHVVRVARALHAILERLGLPSHPKTSGATGLHILLPLGARYDYEQTRTFARLLATLGQQAEPEISTLERAIEARGGKVYIDWGQNGPGQTIVAPFSARPRPGATVSCPLTWDEVDRRLDPRRFTIATVPPRLRERGDPLAPVLSQGIDLRAALEGINRERRR